jgi:hypothetical protein
MGFPSLAGVNPTYGNEFEPLEKGTYLVAITDYAFKTGKNGWEGIRFEFTVQTGKSAKRKLWHQFTVAHDKKDVADRGRSDLVGMLTAAGHPNPTNPDSAPIKGLQLGVKLRVRKNKETGESENAIVKWMPKAEAVLAGVDGAKGALNASIALTSLGASTQISAPQPVATGGDDKLNDEIPF